MKNLAYTVIVFFFCLVFTSCSKTVSTSDASAIMNTDREFSDYSVKHGMKKAFLEYADTAVVLLRQNNYPIEGKNGLREAQKKVNDSLFTLSWEPLHGFISTSEDMGYTYGTYQIIPRDSSNSAKIEKGTYITIWKKEPDGKWKFTFDAGSEGLGK